MAIIPVIIENRQTPQEVGKVHTATWSSLQAGDEGEPLAMATSNDRSLQIFGTFGGATVELRGSNDGVNYVVLADTQGIPLSFNTAKIEVILELTLFVKPVVVGGDGTTNLNAVALVRKGA